MQTIYEQGDIVWIDFAPTRGHEQNGRRPAIIYSIPDFQKITGLIAVMPITSKFHKYNISVKLPDDLKTKGYIICQQFKTIDSESSARNVVFIEHTPQVIVNELVAIMDKFIKP